MGTARPPHEAIDSRLRPHLETGSASALPRLTVAGAGSEFGPSLQRAAPTTLASESASTFIRRASILTREMAVVAIGLRLPTRARPFGAVWVRCDKREQRRSKPWCVSLRAWSLVGCRQERVSFCMDHGVAVGGRPPAAESGGR
eukprot:4930531-Prymnesium_polylepis.1